MKNSDYKRLSTLIGNTKIINTNDLDPDILGLAYDSRNVEPGYLFIALPGVHTNGHAFIEKAIEAGATAVLYSEKIAKQIIERYNKTAFVQTENTRKAMADIAAAFYDNPAERLITVGVTGTDGKTTTVYFIDQLLEMMGKKSGFVSTAACKTEYAIEKNPYRQSTPEAVDVNMMLNKMVNAGKNHAVVEATSHGLSEKNNRLGFLSFNATIFTNLSHEHLEFHGSLKQYRYDKANLFRKLRPSGFGIVNMDDKNSDYFIESTKNRVYTCSLKDSSADFFADNIKTSSTGSTFRINTPNNILSENNFSVEAEIKLPGLFNIENALEAFACVSILTKSDPFKIACNISKLTAVKGRMKVINHGQPFTMIVDYAHTPGSFQRLFPDMRKQTKGRLIAVFGSAGERDIDKRFEQGEIAATFADIIILTDEDPRGEAGIDIIDQIADGVNTAERGELKPIEKDKNLFFIPDRKNAIKKAAAMALKDDTVLLLGKGHESSIIYKDYTIAWDEQIAAEEALNSIGYLDSTSF